MKKLLVLLVLGLALQPAHAQKGKFFVQLGATAPNYPGILLTLFSEYQLERSLPAIQLQGGYFPGKRFSLSVSVNASSASTQSRERLGSDINGNPVTYRITYQLGLVAVLLNADFYYISTDSWNLGSGIAFGAGMISAASTVTPAVYHTDDFATLNGPAWQLNLITARYYFAPHFGIHTSLGVGFNGIFGFGVQGRF